MTKLDIKQYLKQFFLKNGVICDSFDQEKDTIARTAHAEIKRLETKLAEKFDDENSLSISSAPLEVLEINKKISIEPQIKKKVEANILSFSEDSVICNIPQDNGKDYYTISLSVGLFGDMTISKGLPIWICIADEGIKTIYIESRTIQKILDKKFESLLDRL